MKSGIYGVYYSFLPIGGHNKCLDVSRGQSRDTLLLWDYHKGDNQCFSIVNAENGQVSLQVKDSGLALTVKEDNDSIVEEKYQKKPTQHFRIHQTSPDSNQVLIYTFCGKALDVPGGNFRSGAKICQYSFNGGDNQIFKMVKM